MSSFTLTTTLADCRLGAVQFAKKPGLFDECYPLNGEITLQFSLLLLTGKVKTNRRKIAMFA